MSWVLAVPAGLSALLLVTAWLEARFLAPHEHAERVRGALAAGTEPGEVEHLAAGLAQQALPADGPRPDRPERAGARV